MSDNDIEEKDELEYLEKHPKVKRLRRKLKKKMLKEKKKQMAMKNKLPQHIIPLPCSDKVGWTEKWSKGRDWLNFPHSYRVTLSGPPSSGKSTTIKNIILRTHPPFESITVAHYSPDDTTEWNDIEAEIIDHIPSPHDIPMEGKKLLILEDLDVSSLFK